MANRSKRMKFWLEKSKVLYKLGTGKRPVAWKPGRQWEDWNYRALQLVTADWPGRKNVALIPKWRSNLGKRLLPKTGKSILMREKRRP